MSSINLIDRPSNSKMMSTMQLKIEINSPMGRSHENLQNIEHQYAANGNDTKPK
jgi:hypothetical protein